MSEQNPFSVPTTTTTEDDPDALGAGSADAWTDEEESAQDAWPASDEAAAAADLTDGTADASADAAPAGGAKDADGVDPATEFKTQLRRLPGDWYVIHSYAGYENRVKANLENRISSLNMEEHIFQV